MKHASCPTCERELETRHTEMAHLPATVVCTGCGGWMRIERKATSGLVRGALILGTLAVAWMVPAVLILLPVYLVLRDGALSRVRVRPIDKRPVSFWTINPETGVLETLSGEPIPRDRSPERGADARAGKEQAVRARFDRQRPYEKAPTVKPATGAKASVRRKAPAAEAAFVAGDFGAGPPHELPH